MEATSNEGPGQNPGPSHTGKIKQGCKCAGCRAYRCESARRWRESHPDLENARRRAKTAARLAAQGPKPHPPSRKRGCRCDQCKAYDAEKTRKWTRKHPERANEAVRRYAQKNPEKVREWARASYRRKVADPARRAALLAQQREYKRRWRQTPEGKAYYKHENALRRKRVKAAAGKATVQQLRQRWAYYAGRCHYCGGEADSWDHVIPISRGGTKWPANLRPACISCNARKTNLAK